MVNCGVCKAVLGSIPFLKYFLFVFALRQPPRNYWLLVCYNRLRSHLGLFLMLTLYFLLPLESFIESLSIWLIKRAHCKEPAKKGALRRSCVMEQVTEIYYYLIVGIILWRRICQNIPSFSKNSILFAGDITSVMSHRIEDDLSFNIWRCCCSIQSISIILLTWLHINRFLWSV